MAPWFRLFWTAYLAVEDILIAKLLRSPTFHRGVRRIHRTVEDIRYGRNPNDPLRQGEATAEPNRSGNFIKYFLEELRNQARGKPTNPPPPAPPKK
ncbi:hypothetical protein C8A01DRAFT_41255 [Parachaetomium inaequale]|uniref:Uncharacterized protein n=1 Tax=Parachaetomium inaequale TaxID=2588326 RepID=A0AAN6PA87_9PEZI|nr:hypothetical protein C8A01DRAFT_41255 [Parachaetomium inaequale]